MQVLSFDMEYNRRRQREYREIGDQLDAIYKLAAALREQGIALPDEVHDWIDHCAEVKRAHPNPDA